ncbi:hypothetical protein TNCV_530981 [Trichonephila clavipes]|nr:hypothetical protein TNCV_530981 [Trichonephila clavipes]
MTTKSIVSVATIVGFNRCHTPRHRLKDALDVSLEYGCLCGLDMLPKLIWCSSGWCIRSQSLGKHGRHVFDWR